jgi:RAB protein geranylgeranyltransferase component A
MSSYSASAATRRGSVVPPLAGVDTPSSAAPTDCDVLISGTGIVESILAAALAWQGTRVLHIDPKPYYGDSSGCLNIDQLMTWVDNVNRGADVTFSNARLYIPRPLVSRKYLVDLSPRLMFAKSDLLAILIKTRVFRYLEFKALGNFHTYENDSFDKVAGSREDIFTDQSLSLATKRGLMRFMKFVLYWETEGDIWRPYVTQPIHKFLSEKFKLEQQQITELVLAVGLCQDLSVKTPIALARIKRYLVSLDIYGNFPMLYSMYGSAGELGQGFSRSAAVAGATYKLDTKLVAYDETTKIASLSDGSQVMIRDRVVLSPNSSLGPSPRKCATMTRMVAFVAKDCKEWFAENESAALVVFPPGTLPSENKSVVHAIVLGSGSGQCPDGQAAWYLSSFEQDTANAHRDLEEAFTKLEASIVRESTEDFEFADVNESDISYRPDGMPVLSSVKLGQSMQNFVPREKLQYVFKLSYTQKVDASETVGEINKSHNDGSVMSSWYLLPEISYDGILAQAKALYVQIVGSDDDFFDVDFEDESVKSVHEDEDEHRHDDKMDDEFGHDMEL